MAIHRRTKALEGINYEPWLYRSTLRREVLLEMKVDRVRGWRRKRRLEPVLAGILLIENLNASSWEQIQFQSLVKNVGAKGPSRFLFLKKGGSLPNQETFGSTVKNRMSVEIIRVLMWRESLSTVGNHKLMALRGAPVKKRSFSINVDTTMTDLPFFMCLRSTSLRSYGLTVNLLWAELSFPWNLLL